MKRSLDVLVEPDGDRSAPPRLFRAGSTLLTVVDAGDGIASARFASWLTEAGATPIDTDLEAHAQLRRLRIVIRASGLPADARKRAAASETAADVVLGSARPAFAKHLAAALL